MSRFQSFCPEAVTALIVFPVSSVVPAITEPQGEERIEPQQGCLFGAEKFMHKTQVQTSRASTILSSLHDVQVCIPLEMDCRTRREFSRKPSSLWTPCFTAFQPYTGELRDRRRLQSSKLPRGASSWAGRA